MTRSIGADSEVGRLRVVLAHRPGPELARITPRTRKLLGFDTVPWPARAQQEHDILSGVLRDHGAEVIYLTELLADVLRYPSARDQAIGSVLADHELGSELSGILRRFLGSLVPADLATVLIGGLSSQELRGGRGLVYDLLGRHDFAVQPLPNLVYARDICALAGDQLVLGTLPGRRRRESDLLAVICAHHPRFAGLPEPYRVRTRLDCGDVLLLGPRAVAVGTGARTTPASAELLARHLLENGAADTVLAVPMSRHGDSRLGAVCTVLDHGVVLMAPARAFTLTALTITSRPGALAVSHPRPFLEAAADALAIDKLEVIGTSIDSAAGGTAQWDDGANALAVGDRVIVCQERTADTNARLTSAGFDVITVPLGELGGTRGGPRSMCAAIGRSPLALGPAAGTGTGAADSGGDDTPTQPSAPAIRSREPVLELARNRG